jgi:hypothetical protein
VTDDRLVAHLLEEIAFLRALVDRLSEREMPAVPIQPHPSDTTISLKPRPPAPPAPDRATRTRPVKGTRPSVACLYCGGVRGEDGGVVHAPGCEWDLLAALPGDPSSARLPGDSPTTVRTAPTGR